MIDVDELYRLMKEYESARAENPDIRKFITGEDLLYQMLQNGEITTKTYLRITEDL